MDKRIKKIVILNALILIILILIVVFMVMRNKEKTLECKSVNKEVVIDFKNNKTMYMSGMIDLKALEVDKDQIEQETQMYEGVKYNKKQNYLIFGLNYKSENINALNYLGFDYNKKLSTYKAIKKSFEADGYYCK